MTHLTITVPDDLAQKARGQGLLDPLRLTPLVCDALARATNGTDEPNTQNTPDDGLSLSEALLSFAGAAGPGLPVDFAEKHDHYIHGTPK